MDPNQLVWLQGSNLRERVELAITYIKRTNAIMPESLQGLHSVLLLDQQDRWRSGDRPTVESYLQLIPELGSDAARLLDVVYQEVVLRDQIGEQPTFEEYARRFPQLKDELKLQFEVHSGMDWSAFAENEPLETDFPIIEGLRVENELGRGSFGKVYRAWQTDRREGFRARRTR